MSDIYLTLPQALVAILCLCVVGVFIFEWFFVDHSDYYEEHFKTEFDEWCRKNIDKD